MKLSTLIEMPLKLLALGKVNPKHDPDFGPHDITVAKRTLASGKYHLAFQHLPFDWYVFVGNQGWREPVWRDETSTSAFIGEARKIMRDNPRAVVFICTESISDEYHMPLTPWILFHRFVQDGVDEHGRSFFRRINDDDKYASSISLSRLIADRCSIGEHAAHEILMSCLQMRSVRNSTINPLDLDIEAITEIALLGKLRVDDAKIATTLKAPVMSAVKVLEGHVNAALHSYRPGIYQLDGQHWLGKHTETPLRPSKKRPS